MARRTRHRLVVLAAVAVILALVAGYASRALFNPDQFADRAAAALQEKAVADELGRRRSPRSW